MELSLREHQSNVIDALRDGFREGIQSQLLYAPTGFGKTEVAIALMKATRDKWKRAAMVSDEYAAHQVSAAPWSVSGAALGIRSKTTVASVQRADARGARWGAKRRFAHH